MKIKVKVPQNGDKWKVAFGSRNYRSRNTATVIFSAIERRLLASPLKEKTSIEVEYDKDTSNETLMSLDARYLLYTLCCFLEDYLEKQFLNQKYKQYSQ